jgi:uncharacterized protein
MRVADVTRKPYLNRREAYQEFPDGSWQRAIYADFVESLDSASRPFPCIFGIQGLRSDQLRYTFLDAIDIPLLACALARYLSEARTLGSNTSLVVFTRPEPVRALDYYRTTFWFILDKLAEIDPEPWPPAIPQSLEDPGWEFCFAGEPIFVVCNTPAHIARQSRRSSSFMVTFQPRWVFDKILGTEKTAQVATTKVRERLISYDDLSPSPHLGLYGHPGNREYKQYFLDDTNGPVTCPYAKLAATRTEKG